MPSSSSPTPSFFFSMPALKAGSKSFASFTFDPGVTRNGSMNRAIRFVISALICGDLLGVAAVRSVVSAVLRHARYVMRLPTRRRSYGMGRRCDRKSCACATGGVLVASASEVGRRTSIGYWDRSRSSRMATLGARVGVQAASAARRACDRGERRGADWGRLIDALWPDRSHEEGAAGLQVLVSQLRRLLEPNRAPGSVSAILVTRPGGYELGVKVVSGRCTATRAAHSAVARPDLDAGDAEPHVTGSSRRLRSVARTGARRRRRPAVRAGRGRASRGAALAALADACDADCASAIMPLW